MNILFMGTPDFALESLKALVEANYNIIGVVTNPDKPKGRGMKMIPPEVKEYALERNIPVYQPVRVKNNTEFIDKMKELNPDVICVVAYGKILPKEILDIPKYGCINVHGSILPKYRGAAPIQWAVLNGDKETGVTTMFMDIGMDTGDIIDIEKTEIGTDETTGELWDRLAIMGGKLLVQTLKEIEEGTVTRTKQGEDFSMAPMLNKEMAKIDWEEKTAEEIHNLVRGLNPIMGAVTFLGEKKIKFWKVQVVTVDDLITWFPELEEYSYKINELTPGCVMFASDKKGLFIKANEGIISVLEIQGENAKRMPIGDFLRGNEIMAGEIFE
ncbi:MAG: methionyl-tRNA formyltransferase [Clostridia bacterium]|nr:methionyl-tRNA formyltransferase [Clostridia bacterium]